jgi:uncharacterized protein YndB with AHSA1/START domain
MNTDRIRKSAIIHAPRNQVWRILSDSDEFSEWFGVKLEEPFAPGARLSAKVAHKGTDDHPFEMTIGRVEPERLLSWRWYPGAMDPSSEHQAEPTTLVSFELDEAPGGTRVTIEESGFDALPEAHRLKAYQTNERVWEMQLRAIDRYLAMAA